MGAYNFNGIDYPSVTTILDQISKGDALLYWASNQAVDYCVNHLEDLGSLDVHTKADTIANAKNAFKETKTDRASCGSIVHGILSTYIRTGEMGSSDDEEVKRCLSAFKEWESKNKVRFIKSELTVYHPAYYYAGTLDFLAEINGQLYIGDFKTSKAIYQGYLMQLAAYWMALQFSDLVDNPLDFQNVGILRLSPEDGDFEFKDGTNKLERNAKAFVSLLDYYYHASSHRLKNNPRVY